VVSIWTNIVEGNGGGQDVSEPDEVYDPANGTFTAVPAGHPPSGQLDIVVVSANLVDRHDLRTGAVTFIAPEPADLVARYGDRCALLPLDCRVSRTATILADGRILLAGGSTVEPLPPSEARYDLRFVLMPVAEVFDAVSGTASPTGPMVRPREGHTATLLAEVASSSSAVWTLTSRSYRTGSAGSSPRRRSSRSSDVDPASRGSRMVARFPARNSTIVRYDARGQPVDNRHDPVDNRHDPVDNRHVRVDTSPLRVDRPLATVDASNHHI
jgi:hypothetical protein